MSAIKIQGRKITDFLFHVDPNLKTAQLKVDIKVSIGRPLEKQEYDAQIAVHVDVHAEDIDAFHLTITECFRLVFEEESSDIKEVLLGYFQDECLNIVYEDIDNAMIGIGQSPIKLKENNADFDEPANDGETP